MKRLTVLLALLVAGCGGKAPPMSAQAKSLAKKFEQQLATNNPAIFKQLCDEVEKMHTSKKLTDEEHEALHKVCGQAKDGQWDRAKAALKPLLEAIEAEKK
jgi:hypothetical protein